MTKVLFVLHVQNSLKPKPARRPESAASRSIRFILILTHVAQVTNPFTFITHTDRGNKKAAVTVNTAKHRMCKIKPRFLLLFLPQSSLDSDGVMWSRVIGGTIRCPIYLGDMSLDCWRKPECLEEMPETPQRETTVLTTKPPRRLLLFIINIISITSIFLFTHFVML